MGDSGATYPAGTPYSIIFSQGVTPQADLNPSALKLVNQYVPLPNTADNQYSFNPSSVGLTDQYIARIDQNLGRRDTLCGFNASRFRGD